MQSQLFIPPMTRAYWALQLAGWGFVVGILLFFYWPYTFQNGRLPYFATDISLCFMATFLLRCTGRILWRSGSRNVSRGLLYVATGISTGFAVEAITEAMGKLFWDPMEQLSLHTLLIQSIDYAVLLGSWCVFYLGGTSFIEARHTETLLHEAQRLAEDAKLRALRSQIQPHFLFNSLNAASSLLAAGYKDDARKMVERLDELLSAMLASQDDHITDLATELDYARKYLEVQQVRYGESLRVEFDIEAGLGSFKVPRWFLVPLLENVVTYGLSAHRDGTPVLLEIRKNTKGLVLSVKNQVVHPAGAVVEGFGIGLRNTRALLRSIYGGFASLSSEQSETSFVLKIELPPLPSPTAATLPTF